MRELHDEFDLWIGAGAPADLPRDVAIHAWACDECLAMVHAVDSLRAIDLAAAPPPPLRAAAPRPMSGTVVRFGRVAAGIVSAMVVGGGAIALGGFLGPPPRTERAAELSPTYVPAERVLSGVGAPKPRSEPTLEPPADQTDDLSSPPMTPGATPVVSGAAEDAASVATIPPGPSAPLPETPHPTASPSGAPTSSPPVNPTPTTAVSATPDLTPAPTAPIELPDVTPSALPTGA